MPVLWKCIFVAHYHSPVGAVFGSEHPVKNITTPDRIFLAACFPSAQ